MLYRWKIWGIIFLLMWVLLLTGCVQVTTHVTVNKDGSMEVENFFLMEKNLLAMAQEDKSEDPFADLHRRLQEEGFKVTAYDKGDLAGIVARKHLAKGEKVELFPARMENGPQVGEKTAFVVERRFFTTAYRLNADIDLTIPEEEPPKEEDEFSALGAAFGNAILNQIRFNCLITLPVKPTAHNADEVADGGRTLKWVLHPGRKYHLEFRGNFLNVANILAVSGAVLALVAALVVSVFITRRKKAYSAGQGMGEESPPGAF